MSIVNLSIKFVEFDNTVKKVVSYRTPKKGSGAVEKHPNTSEVSKKEYKKFYETFKGSSRVSRGRTLK